MMNTTCRYIFNSLIISGSFSMRGTYHKRKMLIINYLTININTCSKNVVKKNSNPMVSCALMSAPGTSKSKKGLE